MTLEQQVAKALRKHHRRFLKEYGWQDGIEDFTRFYAPYIAAAIEAAYRLDSGRVHAWVSGSDKVDHEAALRALKGEP